MTANYQCADEPGGSGLKECFSPVPSGSPFDTSTVGSYSPTVGAQDYAGNVTTVRHGYAVVSAGTTTGSCVEMTKTVLRLRNYATPPGDDMIQLRAVPSRPRAAR